MRRIEVFFCVRLFVLLLVYLCGSVTAAFAQHELKYTLSPTFNENATRFRIELKFKGEASGTTKVVLPNRWGGQANLYQAVQQLQVVSPNAKLSDTSEPYVKTITHRPNETLHVRYEMAQDFAGLPQGARRDYYRPILQKDYFHWIGHGAWVRPQWDEDKSVRISLRWTNLPKNWIVADSFGANQKNQSFQTTLEDFNHAVFAGGDFRIRSVPVNGNSVFTAMRGSWQFSDEAFAEMVQKIIKIERDFWSDNSVPYYLVTLLPLEAPPNSTNTGGTGLTNSFANFATRNAELNYFKHLLAHEYFHNWNSPRLGRLPEENDKLLYWFSEGFTDYYANLLLLRGGLITLDEYLERYNSWIREYYLSPVRNANNQRVLQDFWNDDDVHDLPYRRGFLLATNWNALIRNAASGKNSLDDAMRDMFRDAKRDQPEITPELIDKYISRYAGRSVLPNIQEYIENGIMITPDKNAFGPFVQMKMTEEPLFELGLDLEALRTKKIVAGVKEGSAAYLAGLRDGQAVVKRSAIYIGDASKQIEMTIKDDAGERIIKYYPASQSKVAIPAYKLRPSISDSERNETLKLLGAVGIRP